MARSEIASLGWGVVLDLHGNVVPNQSVEINKVNGDTASVYAGATGATAQTPVTDSSGYIQGWLEDGEYTVSVNDQTLHVSTGTREVDVLQFGADPTGVADSTNAFQAAHDYLDSLGSADGLEKVISVPDGTYLINGPGGVPYSSGGHSWCVHWYTDNLTLRAGPNVIYKTTWSAHTFLLAGCCKGGDPLTWRSRWINDPATTTYYPLTGTTVTGARQITLASAGNASHFAVGDWIYIRTGSTTNGFAALGWTSAGDSELNQVSAISGATITVKFPLSKPYTQEYYYNDPFAAAGGGNVFYTNLSGVTGSTTWPALYGVANVTDRLTIGPKVLGGRFLSTGDLTTTPNPGGSPRTPWPIYALGTVDFEFAPDGGSEVAEILCSANISRGRIMDLKRVHHTGTDYPFHAVFNADTGDTDMLVKPFTASCEYGVNFCEIHEGAANITILPCTLINAPGFTDAGSPCVSMGARLYNVDLHPMTIVNGPTNYWTITYNDNLNVIYQDICKNRIMAPKLLGEHGTQGIYCDVQDCKVTDWHIPTGVRVRLLGVDQQTATVDTDWHYVEDASLGTGWTRQTGNKVRYRRLTTGEIHVEGAVANFTGAGLTVDIFTLPSGYVPFGLMTYPTNYDNELLQFESTSGRVFICGTALTPIAVPNGHFYYFSLNFWPA